MKIIGFIHYFPRAVRCVLSILVHVVLRRATAPQCIRFIRIMVVVGKKIVCCPSIKKKWSPSVFLQTQ